MACSHPLLHVNDILDATRAALDLIWHFGVRVGLLRALEIAPKVL